VTRLNQKRLFHTSICLDSNVVVYVWGFLKYWNYDVHVAVQNLEQNQDVEEVNRILIIIPA